MVYLNREKSVKELVCGRIALRGQTRAHSPQSMQRSSRIVALPLRTRMACVGQALMQAMRPAQLSWAMRTEWKYCSMLSPDSDLESGSLAHDRMETKLIRVLLDIGQSHARPEAHLSDLF